MKKHLPSILPALALLTLGGCAASSNLATTESDGMYYSATDRVTTVAVPAAQQGPDYAPGDVANPDYSGSSARSGDSEYYDDDYYASAQQPRRNNNYRGGSLGYYSFPYADPFYYGYGGPMIGYSPYSAFGYSPYGFYDPFYRPYYGYGGLTINIGFGFGRGYYRPFGYGGGYDSYYGYGGYGSPYGSWGNYYGGHYGNGYGGYYGNRYGNNGYYGTGTDRVNRNVTYGPRRSRTGSGAGLPIAPDGSSNSKISPDRSRVVQEGRFATPAIGNANTPAGQYNGRGRVRDVTVGTGSNSATGQPASVTESGTRTSRYRDAQTMPGAATASQPENTTRRWRVLDNSAPNNGSSAPDGRMVDRSAADQPQSGRSRRATYYGGDNGSSQQMEQPRRQRMSDASSTPSRSDSQPTRKYSEPTRSYSQPEPSRSYSEPSRSYSSPSSSPSSSPRSSSPSDGGGGGGGRGRVR